MKKLNKSLEKLKLIREPYSVDIICKSVQEILYSVYKINVEAILFLPADKSSIRIWYKSSNKKDSFLIDMSSNAIKSKSTMRVEVTLFIPLYARGNYFGCIVISSKKSKSIVQPVEYIKSITDELNIFVDYFAMFLYSEKLSFEANIDKLTKINNRGYILNYISNSFSKNKPYSVILFDIDKFKHYNDRYGHPIGDHILSNLAKILKYCLAKQNKHIKFARYGGEEFIIILPTDRKEIIIATMEHIRSTIAAADFSTSEYLLKVTVSLGASVGRSDEDIYTIIEEADKSLYIAKESGRNRYVFYQHSEITK